MISLLVIIVLSYLAGSIPGSLWTGLLLNGIDVRKHGSGNAGATNTFRVLGWRAGVIATLVDVGKGFLAAGIIARIRIDGLPAEMPFWDVEVFAKMLAGVAAVTGHVFPVFAGFRGGKGVATAGGVLLALTPLSMGITVAMFLLVLLTTRYVSLASICASITFPASVAIRKYIFGIDRLDASLFIISLVLAAGLIVAHRSNIARLIKGTERRVRTFRPARGMAGRGELE